MKIGKWAWGCLAVLPLLAGCSGFWNAPASTTTTTTTTLSSGYFYVLDKNDSQLISYYISSGALKKVANLALPAEPIAMTLAPNGEFLYVSTYSGIFVYTVSSGTMTLTSTTALVTDEATALAVDGTNSWLLEGYGDSGTIYLYAIPISSSTGLVSTTASACTGTSVVCSTTITGTNTGAALNQIALSPTSNNKFVFAAIGSYGLAAFDFTASNTNPFSTATIKTPTNSAGATLCVAVDPSNRMVYVGESDAVSGSGGLRAFTFAAGTSAPSLSEISSTPYSSGGSGPHAILPSSSGDVVYVANWNGTGSGNITGFAISTSGTSYSLSQLSATATTGIEPSSMIEDSDENFVLVENAGGSPYLDAYIFDTTTATTLDLSLYDSTYSGISMVGPN